MDWRAWYGAWYAEDSIRVSSRFTVSLGFRDEFDNGKEYYKLEGQVLREPDQAWAKPSAENLDYHACMVFRQ